MIRRLLTTLLTKMVRAYQLIVSPWFAPTCRYYPSCSQYAIDALREHGPARGTMLTGWRLLRCNPWSKGGVDHVPPRKAAAPEAGPGERRDSTGEGESLIAVDSSTSRHRAAKTRDVTQPAWRTLHGNL